MDPIFKSNPNLQQYFETSDGTKFYAKHHAREHARTLKDRTISTINRGETPKAKKSKVKQKSNNLTNGVKKPNDLASTEEVPKNLTPMAKAKLRAEAIQKMNTIAEVEEALKDETAKTVKKAGNDRIAAITAANALNSDEENENVQTK